MLGLHCCSGFSPAVVSLSPVVVHRLLIEEASPVAQHGLQGAGFSSWGVWAQWLQFPGSLVWAHRLSRPSACGIFPDQGSNPCLLHWQADSLPLSHQGSPLYVLSWMVLVGFHQAEKLRKHNANNLGCVKMLIRWTLRWTVWGSVTSWISLKHCPEAGAVRDGRLRMGQDWSTVEVCKYSFRSDSDRFHGPW